MARIEKVGAREIYCDRARRKASLLEDRIYPSDRKSDNSNGFHISVRTCSLSRMCSCLSYGCKWTGLNPDYDPFENP